MAVWCLSIQQFGSDFLRASVELLLMAVVHALDNPFGSQSITFEAMQVCELFKFLYIHPISLNVVVECAKSSFVDIFFYPFYLATSFSL